MSVFYSLLVFQSPVRFVCYSRESTHKFWSSRINYTLMTVSTEIGLSLSSYSVPSPHQMILIISE